MNRRFRTFLSVGALLFAMVDADKNSAIGNEVVDRAVANECASRLRSHLDENIEHIDIGHIDIGRLSRFTRIMGAHDTVALKLTFSGRRSTFAYARQKLHERKAHFIQQGLQDFKHQQSFWQSRDPHGTGHLYIRVTKTELIELQPYIELANKIEPIDAVGREDDHHVLHSGRSFEDRIDRREVKYWKWMDVQPEKVIHVQTVTSYDKTKFHALADKIDRDDNGVRVAHTYFDSLLSVGFMTLEAKVKDLKQVVESTPEIHLVHITGALGSQDEG